jgi:signal transduction histidine kinase
MVAVNIWITVLAASRSDEGLASALLSDAGFLLAFVVFFPGLGVLLATRRPENVLGWLMLGIGLFAVEPFSTYGLYLLDTGRERGAWFVAATSWSWVPVIGVAGIHILLLFPDGRLPSPRWRRFVWPVSVAMALVSIGIFIGPGDLRDFGYENLRTPYGVEGLEWVEGFFFIGLLAIPIGIVGAAWSLVVRFRRSGPTERAQIRWLASAAVVVAALYGVALIASIAFGATWESNSEDPGWILVLQNVAVFSFVLIPVAIAIAVLRYRLYDIDLVIRKSLIFAVLAAFIGAVYAGVVGGVGALVDSRGPVLSFAAAALLAVLFQPARDRARRLADRIVYGKRATPYEVLAEFSERVGETYSAEDVLPRMARIAAEGVGAHAAQVWIASGGRIRVAASWPEESDAPAPMALPDEGLPDLPGADATFAVEHQGELLGALAVATPANDPMNEAKRRLVSDLASQAGLVLRNVRLTEELRRRLDDLKAAQKRLVAAQDEERRRIERNIHDGAQQQLVSLSVQLRLAQSLVGKDPAKAEGMLGDLQTRTTETLEDLRDLARGIYPPLLADKGLPAALEAQARKSTLPIEINTDGASRYTAEVEAAVYFSVLEALQNVAKYADASRVDVRLSQDDGYLAFEVTDDGRGFDPARTGYGTGLQGIADRLGALEGSIDVDSQPGRGTRVREDAR